MLMGRTATSVAPRRPGLDPAYLERKRQAIRAELRSQSHFENTDTVIYGKHDPFDVPLALCEDCDVAPELMRVSEDPVRWHTACPHCSRGPRETRPWPHLAALAWNQINLSSQDYRDLPLFWLDDLEPAAARVRMTGIRHDLELRKNLAGLERRLARPAGRRPPGKSYLRRLDAYLQWSILALRLITYTIRR
jgi:hypothetical protein